MSLLRRIQQNQPDEPEPQPPQRPPIGTPPPPAAQTPLYQDQAVALPPITDGLAISNMDDLASARRQELRDWMLERLLVELEQVEKAPDAKRLLAQRFQDLY